MKVLLTIFAVVLTVPVLFLVGIALGPAALVILFVVGIALITAAGMTRARSRSSEGPRRRVVRGPR